MKNEIKDGIAASNRSVAITLKNHLDTIQQAVKNDSGEGMCNQTADLVIQLAEKQKALAIQLVARQEDLTTKLMDGLDCLDLNISNKESLNCSNETTANPTENCYWCGGIPGWRHVVSLNMTRTDFMDQCPDGWQLTNYSKRTCGRVSTSENTCDSTVFPTGGLPYSQVCGHVAGYQFGAVSAFYRSSQNIESVYVNGLSLTHGSPRQHVWTFAVGLAESSTVYQGEWCPCDGGISPVPTFMGGIYSCESGINGPWVESQFIFHPGDRLWDGEDCLPISSCCANTLPYFIRDLGYHTTDDIEARLCSVYNRVVSDIAMEVVELYVK